MPRKRLRGSTKAHHLVNGVDHKRMSRKRDATREVMLGERAIRVPSGRTAPRAGKARTEPDSTEPKAFPPTVDAVNRKTFFPDSTLHADHQLITSDHQLITS